MKRAFKLLAGFWPFFLLAANTVLMRILFFHNERHADLDRVGYMLSVITGACLTYAECGLAYLAYLAWEAAKDTNYGRKWPWEKRETKHDSDQ